MTVSYYRDTCSSMVIAALFTISRKWKQPKCPLADERLMKIWCTATMEYYSAIKKTEIIIFANKWMETKTVSLSEETQTQEGKYHIVFLLCRC